LASGPPADRGRAPSQGATRPEGTHEVPHAPVEHPHSPVAYRAVSGGPSPAPPVAHASRGLGPRARLSSRRRAAGGLHAHIWWGGSLPKRSGPRRSTFLDDAGEFLPEPTATKHHHESSHDHRPPGQLLVPRRPSIEPLPRRSLAHGGHRRRPPVRRSPAVPPHKFRRALAPRYTSGPPRPLPWPSPPPDPPNSGEPPPPTAKCHTAILLILLGSFV
jgi:hypothetical protein